MKKSNIKLEITTDFMDNKALLNFLAASSINIFLYDEEPGRGLSSVMDYVICINKPVAISKSNMFRHVFNTIPSICADNRSLLEIMKSNNDSLLPFREKWSHANFIKRYETIIDSTRKI